MQSDANDFTMTQKRFQMTAVLQLLNFQLCSALFKIVHQKFFGAMQVLIMDRFNMHENLLSLIRCSCGFYDNFIIPDVQTKLLD